MPAFVQILLLQQDYTLRRLASVNDVIRPKTQSSDRSNDNSSVDDNRVKRQTNRATDIELTIQA